ncbi:MAG: hypothetical protein HYW50_00265 [Candidatus Diapherotrites archaeon]|nr:hypothetical protein [Candidatus Diapherotrites archaeon]
MNQQDVLNALSLMREISKKRNFLQSVDFNISFTGIDFKKPENRVDVDVILPNSTGKQGSAKVVVFARDKEFAEQLKGKAKVVLEEEIASIKPKDMEQYLANYDLFLAEGPSILTVAKYCGQQLAPKGKMPKPINADLKAFELVVSKASTSIKVSNSRGKFMPVVHVMVGREGDENEKISQNILTVYNAVLSSLGGKSQNIKSAFVKLTMGPSVKIGISKEEADDLKQKLLEKNKNEKIIQMAGNK